ncbi:hypothetical protein M422DRAFT_240416 [Sphaerobolus stellatus SS14]|nr:hypothetical protein M422DRAFT_240416 [Sphaerobolus stellatus SS14]
MSNLGPLVESLPPGLWDEIIRDLEVHDIAALRLTCKSSQDKLWPVILKFFADTKVNLFSRDSLQRLVAVSEHKDIRREDTHRKLLTEAFQELKALTTLSFGLIVYNGMDTEVPGDTVEWKSREKLGGFTLRAFEVGVSTALRSGLSLGALNIFGEGCRGGLPSSSDLQQTIDRLREPHAEDGLCSVLNKVRSFKYFFASKSTSFEPLELLSLVDTQNLENLAIAFVASDVFYQPLMDRLPSFDFSRLCTFTLDNVTIEQQPLLQYVQKNVTIERLELRNVLLKGTWKPILVYCCGTPKDPKKNHEDIPYPDSKDIIIIPKSDLLHHPNLRTLILEYIREHPADSDRYADRVRFLSDFVDGECTTKLRLHGDENLRKWIQYAAYAGRTTASAAVMRAVRGG